MDLNRKYIKMCEKAEEVQREWEPQIGDYFFRKDRKGIGVITGISPDGIVSVTYLKIVYDREFELYNIPGIAGSVNHAKKTKIWLPRQDQLQEKLENDYYYHSFVLDEVNDVMKKIYSDDGLYSPFESGEQFWLAFLMHEKYRKIWSDKKEEWIETKEGW